MNRPPNRPKHCGVTAPRPANVWLLLLLLTLFVLPAAPARSQDFDFTTDWQEAALSGLSGVSLAIVEREEGGFLSYRMGGPSGMSAASSIDGVVWTPEPGFVSPPGGPDKFVSNPWVFRLDQGGFRMIYEIQDGGGNRRFYSAFSPDGLVFQAEDLVMAGDDEDRSPGDGTMFLSVPTGFRLPDGGLKMFFVSQGDRIRSALSLDQGLTWVKDPGTRMELGVDPCPFLLEDGGLRLIYVDWSTRYRVKRILFADSENGLDFTYQGKIVSSDSVGGQTMMVDPELIRLPEGGLRLFFSHGQGEEIPIYTALPPEDWPLTTYPLIRPK